MEEVVGNSDSDSSSAPQPDGRFPRTHWSIVLCAGDERSPDAREAFGRLYRAYLPPLLAFLRREGRSQPEAEDLAQGFFEFLLEKRGLGKVRPEGKFRCWLLASLKHYLSDVWDKARAIKRGGGQIPVPLDPAENAPGPKLTDSHRTPDEEYDHQFALRFLDLVIGQLQQECHAGGKPRVFEELKPLLLDTEDAMSHAECARRLGMSAGAVATELWRLRGRYREIFDRELKKLIGSADDPEAEKRFLFAALSK